MPEIMFPDWELPEGHSVFSRSGWEVRDLSKA